MVKVLIIRCLTLLNIYRLYDVAVYMVFSFITPFIIFGSIFFHCMFCMFMFNFEKYAFLLLCLCNHMFRSVYCFIVLVSESFVCKCVLYCFVLYCTVLYCIVLYCNVLCCTLLYCTVLYCTVL